MHDRTPRDVTVTTAAGWVLVAEYEPGKEPRGVVLVHQGETGTMRIFAAPVHGDGPPEPTDSGIPLAPGGRERVYGNLPGRGTISRIWARCTADASIHAGAIA